MWDAFLVVLAVAMGAACGVSYGNFNTQAKVCAARGSTRVDVQGEPMCRKGDMLSPVFMKEPS